MTTVIIIIITAAMGEITEVETMAVEVTVVEAMEAEMQVTAVDIITTSTAATIIIIMTSIQTSMPLDTEKNIGKQMPPQQQIQYFHL